VLSYYSIIITDNNKKKIMQNFTSLNEKIKKTHKHVRTDLLSLKTGKASADMLDRVRVEAYGGQMKIVEVATVSVQGANMLLVEPWDKSLLEATERGIRVANLNLNPIVDGNKIRIAVPPLTEETRKEMVQILHKKIESAKNMIRATRNDEKKEIEKLKGTPGISEDDIKSDLEELDKIIKKAIDGLEQISADKEKALMTI